MQIQDVPFLMCNVRLFTPTPGIAAGNRDADHSHFKTHVGRSGIHLDFAFDTSEGLIDFTQNSKVDRYVDLTPNTATKSIVGKSHRYATLEFDNPHINVNTHFTFDLKLPVGLNESTYLDFEHVEEVQAEIIQPHQKNTVLYADCHFGIHFKEQNLDGAADVHEVCVGLYASIRRCGTGI